jgi:anti-anti-sigma factor
MLTEQVKVFQPIGNFDATKSQELRHLLSQLTQCSTKVLLVDLKDVTFMDSVLVLAFKNLRAANAKLVVCSINEQVRILFELTGMDKVFEIFANQQEFEKSMMSRA